MSYTKGEWTVSEYDVREAWDDGQPIRHYMIQGTIAGKSERTIADVGAWRDRDNAEDDARLIAAAPALLEALKWYVMACGNTAAVVDREAVRTAWDKAQAAIAQAEGK